MTQSYPAYQLTCADIDRIKVVAARIFDRKVSPQSRLEIIARSSGFNTFAAMKAALQAGPVWLLGDQYREEEHIRQAGIDLSRVPFISGISLNEIIAAGLSWSERGDPEWAATKSPRQRLKALKRDGGSLHDYLDFLYKEVGSNGSTLNVYRSSLTWADIRGLEDSERNRWRARQNAVIMTTPQNASDVSFDFETEEPRAMRPGEWRCARVPLSDDVQFFDTPEADPVPWNDREALSRLIEDARIIVFDESDLSEVKLALKRAGIPPLGDYRFSLLRADALELEGEREGNFFTVGYDGTARNDAPSDEVCKDTKALSDFTFRWMCEIVNVVHGCQYEYRRLSMSDLPSTYVSKDSGHPRLTVPV